MFSSTPFAYTNQATNQISKEEEEHPCSFSPFLSPFLDYDDDELLLNNPLSNPNSSNINKIKAANDAMEMKSLEPNRKKRRHVSKQPRKKSLKKKDRHSKICTAQGLRDRRIRLSLQIARKFFDLQDMLGYDKASKTIEWLFGKSKSAIKEVAMDHVTQLKHIGSSSLSASESEAVSSIVESKKNFKKSRRYRPEASDLVVKESRDRARARARERTREKMVLKGIVVNPKSLLEHQMDSDMVSCILGISSGPTILPNSVESSEMFSSNLLMGLTENWDKMNPTRFNSPRGSMEAENPSAFLRNASNALENGPNSGYVPNLNAYEPNPNSVFLITTTASQEQNPSSIPTITSNVYFQSQLLENRFPCNSLRQESQFLLNYGNSF